MLKAARKEIERVAEKLFDLNQKLEKGSKFMKFGTGLQHMARQLKASKLKDELYDLTELVLDYEVAQDGATASTEDATNALDDYGDAATDATDSVTDLADETFDASHDIFDLAVQTDNLRVATRGLKDISVNPFQQGKKWNNKEFLEYIRKTKEDADKILEGTTRRRKRRRTSSSKEETPNIEMEMIDAPSLRVPKGMASLLLNLQYLHKRIIPKTSEEAELMQRTFNSAVNSMSENTEYLLTAWEQVLITLDEMSVQVTESIASGIGDAFANAVIEGESFGKAMQQIFKDIMKQIIATIAKQLILNALMGATGGAGVLGQAVNDILGITPANDIAFGPSAGRFITGPEGTFSLNPNDSVVAGTNLFGGGQGSKNMTVNGYIDGSSIFLSNTRQTNTVNRLS